MDVIERLMHGAVDIHVHHGPDARTPRRLDAQQTAIQAEQAGMRAIVLKNRDYPTAPLASTVSQSAPRLTVCGSICLDFAVGGLNPHALETSALLGAKVAWMPTFSSTNHQKALGSGAGGICVLDNNGGLVREAQQCLDILKKHDMVLATGHISPVEAFALVAEARSRGITKIVVTHPLNAMVGAALTIEEQQLMAVNGALIEHCAYLVTPLGGRLNPRDIVEAVRAVGAEHCVLSTDLGQDYNPTPAEGMRMMIGTLLKCGLSATEIETMVQVNPARLLNLG